MPDSNTVASVEKAAALLMLFGADGVPVELSIQEIASLLHVPKSTAHRLCATLVRQHFLEQNKENKKYLLGLSARILGDRYLKSHNLERLLPPHLKTLVQMFGESVSAAVLDKTETVIYEKLEGTHALRVATQIGNRNPLHCTGSGKVFLSYMPAAERETLLNVVTGVYAADSGSILMDGREIQNLPPEQVCAAGIARTFQNIRLFSTLPVLGNVMVGGFSRQKSGVLPTILHTRSFRKEEAAMREKALECLAFVGLEGKKDARVENLTYAQQRFLEIARALAASPKILLLDEPAAGMNAAEIEHLTGIIKRLGHSGITLLLIEHVMGLVRGVTDQVMVLNYGERIAMGTYQQIESDPLVVEAYLGKGAIKQC